MGSALGQRGWNGQPLGLAAGLGGSPFRPGHWPLAPAPNAGSGRQQRLGVRMARVIEDVVAPPHFDDPAEVHHRHPVTDLADGGEVMRDQHDAEPSSSLSWVKRARTAA